MTTLISKQQLEHLCMNVSSDTVFHTNLSLLKHYVSNEACAPHIIEYLNRHLTFYSTPDNDKVFETISDLLEFCNSEIWTEYADDWLNIATRHHHSSDFIKPRYLILVGKEDAVHT